MEAAKAPATAQPPPATGAERRRYPRIVFSPKDGVSAGLRFLTSAGEDLPIQAMVMNLSLGGLGMGIPRDELGGLTLSEGDRFTVVELRIAYWQVRLPLDVGAQIRWTVDADYIDHICFGCAFDETGYRFRRQLTGFVERNFSHLSLV